MYLAMILSYLLCYLCMYSVILLKFVWVYSTYLYIIKKTFLSSVCEVLCMNWFMYR